MNESEVFGRVLEWLDGEGYRSFIHVPGAHQSKSDYAELLATYQTHEIGISGYKPDVLGFTPADRVFAVEVKGKNHLRRGLGQAISYQRGVDHTYLAADANMLERIHDLALSKGIGILAVSETSVEDIHPTALDMRDQLYNTRRQLEWLSTTTGSISTRLPTYTNPMNNLMPALAIANHNCRTKDQIKSLVEQTSYPFQRELGQMIGLAQSLGLIVDYNNKLELTDQGRLAVTTLRGKDITTVSELKEAKPSRKSLVETHPALAVFLRNRFAAIPEYQTLFRVLLAYPEGISIRQLCQQLIDNHPDTFTNLLYVPYQDNRNAPQLIETGRGFEIYEDSEYMKKILHSQFLSNTVSQFRSIGILHSDTSPIEPKSKLEPEEDYWYPDKFSLQ